MNYIVKPQSPLMLGENGILPLTSYDQIIMPDGGRWDGSSTGSGDLTCDPREEDEGNPELNSVPINADQLGGVDASEYVKKSDFDSVSGLPDGGTTGQVLTKASNTDGDASWKSLTDAGTTWSILWENASQGSSFAAQTISVNMTGYDMFAIVVNQLASAATNVPALNIFKRIEGSYTLIPIACRYDGAIYACTRNITVNFDENTFSFGDGSQNGNVNNDRQIPTIIFGIKGVSSVEQ